MLQTPAVGLPEYVVCALGDLPHVRLETVDCLVAAAHENEAGIAVVTDDGHRGNPAVFHRRHFAEVAVVDGDRGSRALSETEPVRCVAVDDPCVCPDVDTKGDPDTLGDGRHDDCDD